MAPEKEHALRPWGKGRELAYFHEYIGACLLIEGKVKLDAHSYFCPMPIILTSKKIKELTMGQVLEVLSDDEGIKKDMPAWCQTTGHEMVGLEEEDTDPKRVYKAYVKKTK